MLPDATVEIISFGTPTGSARIAGVANAVAPEPPAEIRPSSLTPSLPDLPFTQVSNASAIAATAAPRSALNTPAEPRG